MQSIRQAQRNQIKERIDNLPFNLKSEGMTIFLFEGLGTLVFLYGINASQYLTPTSSQVPNIYWTFFVSAFLFFGIAIAAPFTGGHINPAVTISLARSQLCESSKVLTYIVSQLGGAFAGVFICTYFNILVYNLFGHSAQIYSSQPSNRDLILDGISEMFGTFIFVFGIIYTCKRNYMKGEYFKYFFIVLMLLVGRTQKLFYLSFTFRQSVLNPAVSFGLQMFASIQQKNSALLFDIWGIVIGQIIGGLLASWFYDEIYEPLLDEVEKREKSK